MAARQDVGWLGWLPVTVVIARVILHSIAELKLSCIHFSSAHLSRSEEDFLTLNKHQNSVSPYNSLSEDCSCHTESISFCSNDYLCWQWLSMLAVVQTGSILLACGNLIFQ